MQQENNNQDVFEMILDSVGNEAEPVFATPSHKTVPEDWHEDHHEGQLAVDVAETPDEIIVVSTMAGASMDRIELYIHNDLLTVRGMRFSPLDAEPQVAYFYQECFWGKFSRTIVLPVDVKGELARAEYTKGVLTVRVPKRNASNTIPITVVDE